MRGFGNEKIVRKAKKVILKALIYLTKKNDNNAYFSAPAILHNIPFKFSSHNKIYPNDITKILEEYMPTGLVEKASIITSCGKTGTFGYAANRSKMKRLESYLRNL